MAEVLIYEERAAVRKRAEAVLRQCGYRTLEAGDRAEIFAHLEASSPALAIVGQAGSGGLESIDFVRELRSRFARMPIVLFAPGSSEELAIAALRAGVQDYVKQPDYDGLAIAVARCIPAAGAAPLRSFASGDRDLHLIGNSPELSRIREYLIKVAASNCNVLITGETGTGKELVAGAIHRNSARRHCPFVVINCAAIPDSLLESELFGHERGAFTGATFASAGKLQHADGGTVFLDEIGDMSLHLQAKILRAIEAKEVQRLGAKDNRSVNIRVVAATNQNLEDQIFAGKFRSDLYFRLAVTQVRLPALRERPEDIPLLAGFFIDQMNRRLDLRIEGIGCEVMGRLMRHSWPGNVRELKNLVEAFSVGRDRGWIGEEDLPHHLRRLGEAPNEVECEERTRILGALLTTNWNKSKAAGELRWSRMTLYRKIAKHRILEPAGNRKPKTAAAACGSPRPLSGGGGANPL